MPSLTPQHRAEEVTWTAIRDGLISGACGLVPSSLGVWAAMKNPKFVRATNWQSRTALVVMPSLFMFAYSAEHKLQHRMLEVASESEHSKSISDWAEARHLEERRKIQKRIQNSSTGDGSLLDVTSPTEAEKETHLTELYRQGVENSGVRIVPGDRLGPHHQFANFWQENPFKILAALGVPTVLYIFKGRQGQQHLQLQMKLMHTRVFGQFAVLTMLLTLMGFKQYMDQNGKFITELEADVRVEEMRRVRAELLQRMERDKKRNEERDAMLKKAHDEDVQSHLSKKEKSQKKKHVQQMEEIAA